jgi:hypothetical protein
MKAYRSLAAVLFSVAAPAFAAASCTSGTTPNCSPDAAGADACGGPFEGGAGDASSPDGPAETAADTGTGSDTGMAMDSGTDTGSSGDTGMGAGEAGEAGGD